jgi:hypothetical protein
MGETSYKEDENTNKKVEERDTQTVDEKWSRIPERSNDYKRDEYPRRPPTFTNQRSFNQYEGNYKRVDHEPRWTTSQRRSLTHMCFSMSFNIARVAAGIINSSNLQQTD